MGFVYIDISHLVGFFEIGRNVTGIQRVTYEIVQGMRRQLGDANVKLLNFDSQSRVLRTAPSPLFDEIVAARGDGASMRLAMTKGSNCWRTASFEKGGVLLLSEGLGDVVRFDNFSRAKEAFGLRVYQVIYDIIPIVKPEYSVRSCVKGFLQTIPRALALADEVITISDFSKHDLLRVCSEMLNSQMPIRVWKLPHEFTVAGQENVALPDGVNEPFVLIGGTIEDRKNQHLVVEAWSKLVAKHGDRMPQLVLVGRFGKITLPLIKMRAKLALETLTQKRFVALGKCNDKMLRALYDHSLFSIYVSSYEGWGLPIGESLWCGRPVLSGIATSLPEVGGDLVDYVDPLDQNALMAAIEKLCFDDEHRERRVKQISKAKLRTWNDAINEFGRIVSAA